MDHSSFVSKARTAFHSAAAKAERVLTDFKSDRDSDKQLPSPTNEGESKGRHDGNHLNLRWRTPHVGTKNDWQDRIRNIRRGRKGVDEPARIDDPAMAAPVFDENLYLLNAKNDVEAKGSEENSLLERLNASDVNSIPSASALKQLAIAVEAGKKVKSMKDFLASSGSSSPVRERMFAEGNFLQRKTDSDSEACITMATFARDIHGAPPECFVVKLSEVIGSFKTLRKMALFWCKVVTQLRRLWVEGQHIPGVPVDEIPDLHCCLLYQQLQVINCCLSRKRRHIITTESLDSVMRKSSSNDDGSVLSVDSSPSSPVLYARTSNGELALRLGADHLTDLTMLETGEPIYSPITQEGPLLTEDLIKETEELVLRTGSVGAGCSQLLSDMQAFKAANPGCVLEDFVRWHSPPDWTEFEQNDECFDGADASSTKGQLSRRMQKKGNLWRELWETAKPVPAVKQTPLFDEDLAVEGILNFFEDIPPSQLFEQLFVSLLGLGFALAEAKLSSNENLCKPFQECKDYVIATCQGSAWSEKIDDIWQVYETVETMLTHPEEVLKALETPATADEPKSRLKRLSLNFGSRDKQKKPPPKDAKTPEETAAPARQPFASFFDGKSSLFSKKPPKPDSISPPVKEKPPSLDDNDWTIV